MTLFGIKRHYKKYIDTIKNTLIKSDLHIFQFALFFHIGIKTAL